MEKDYTYVLIYECGGREVVMTATPNYKVVQCKKAWYDQHLGKEGKIKKLHKGA